MKILSETEREQLLKKHIPILLGIALMSMSSVVSAQSLFGQQSSSIGSNAPSYYYLGGKEGLMIGVNLWGFVDKPGRYEVPSSTDLVQLISYGGGPLVGANLAKVKIVREILQPDSSYKTEIIPVDLEHFEKKGAQPVLLLPGDTIIVPGSTFSTIQEVIPLLGYLGAILSGVGPILLELHY